MASLRVFTSAVLFGKTSWAGGASLSYKIIFQDPGHGILETVEEKIWQLSGFEKPGISSIVSGLEFSPCDD